MRQKEWFGCLLQPFYHLCSLSPAGGGTSFGLLVALGSVPVSSLVPLSFRARWNEMTAGVTASTEQGMAQDSIRFKQVTGESPLHGGPMGVTAQCTARLLGPRDVGRINATPKAWKGQAEGQKCHHRRWVPAQHRADTLTHWARGSGGLSAALSSSSRCRRTPARAGLGSRPRWGRCG